MPWGAAVAAAVAGLSGAHAAKQQAGKVLVSDGTSLSWESLPQPIISPSKCPSCGSRHFKQIESGRICAFCRSEQ